MEEPDVEKAEHDGLAKVTVIDEPDGRAAHPPSYKGRVLARIKSTEDSSVKGRASCIQGCCSLFCGSVYFIIVIIIMMAIPISSIAIGATYLEQCPRERYIPIFLIVGGVFGALVQLSRIIHLAVKKNDDNKDSARPNPFDGIVGTFLFAWFIAGNVWVFRTFGDYTTEDSTAQDYCHPTVYLYAFWLIITAYILMALGCCCICVGCVAAGVAACCCARCHKDDSDQ